MTVGNSTPATHIERIHSLDGLRALAVSLVVAHHLGVSAIGNKLQQIGFGVLGSFVHGLTASGVELFFVLSGVVLLKPYLTELRPFNLATYFWRRFVRLYPPYLVALLLSAVSVWCVARFPSWWTPTAAVAPFSWRGLFSQVGIIYFGVAPFNFAWWSLTVEIIFYGLAPVLIWAGAGRGLQFGVGMLLLTSLAAVSLTLGLWAVPIGMHRYVSVFFQYSPCFAMGVMLALQPMRPDVASATLVAGALYVVCAAFEATLNVHMGWALVYGALVSFASIRHSKVFRFFAKPSLVWLGERSYSLFLTHYAVIVIVCALTASEIGLKGLSYFVISRAGALVASLVVACALFHFVEARFARGLATADRVFPISG